MVIDPAQDNPVGDPPPNIDTIQALMAQSIASELAERARAIRFLLTDSDGVLTDTGVYYSDRGEELKRFSIRDGMGVERLRKFAGVDVAIITGEQSGPVQKRAEKLQIKELHQGIKDKPAVLRTLLDRYGLHHNEIAYIGDDTNDVAIMKLVGLAACPADATPFARAVAHFICPSRGGHGAFRDFAELIIAAKAGENPIENQPTQERINDSQSKS